MNIFNRILRLGAERQDILLVIFLAAILFMIVVPLPTWLIDSMITVNFMLAFLILMVGLYLPKASEFTALPAIILLTTLFRLAISISTTRLILLNADAGQIVETFGQFVVGGSLIVGIIIFLIITIVQFVVITKGAERVAEVGARFSLDAMPGKQMAIDSDVRTGDLDIKGARDSRAKIQTESQFYGAMDGTMKFVKGDSIAGLVIIFVNIVGGMSMGVAIDGLSFGEAAELYTILTIGDGLVSQIPALIIAISAGSVVTRVSDDKTRDLGNDIVKQLGANAQSLQFTGVLLIGFALIPGFPKVAFVGAGLLAISGGLLIKRRHLAEADKGSIEQTLKEAEERNASPIRILVPQDIYDTIDQAEFTSAVTIERRVLLASLGMVFPHYAIHVEEMEQRIIELRIENVVIFRQSLPDQAVVALDTGDNLETMGTKPIGPVELWSSEGNANWIPIDDADKISAAGCPVLSLETTIARAISYSLPRHITFFLGVQETRNLLNKANRNYPDLVEEVLEHVKLPALSEILQDLVREEVSIRDLRTILEGVVKWAPKEKDREVLTEYVRSYLSHQISASVSADMKTIYGFVFAPELEEVIRGNAKVTSVGTYLALPYEAREKLLGSLRKNLDGMKDHEGSPILVTSMDIRRLVRTFLWTNSINIPILSQQDIAPDFRVQLLGEIKE